MFSRVGMAKEETLRSGEELGSATGEYHVVQNGLPNQDLPAIPANEVRRRNGKSCPDIWIVIDDIVYDCTIFVNEHPGGDTVIRSFAGKDCSWQFHRVHGFQKNRKWLPGLRVGQTKGVENPYPKPKS
ncbi:uncharacterized protein A1O5_10943 [Cladophialophora psammophila CBS 110553]|uniref:Cytochrome b5 heme-binding domain-containing protein n=1 Tax=Cladophialophora psammophila CBS 110553 TaxID=1182543 RepID=W9WCX4_9EURO|nr:uncharacterized protein A1O5_10943 [Cladophialophora psammophila CBS 110553]EXJ65967.1 hypothetical protein A1O5_10943 [Cladophialophora psammophila CBS 110553]